MIRLACALLLAALVPIGANGQSAPSPSLQETFQFLERTLADIGLASHYVHFDKDKFPRGCNMTFFTLNENRSHRDSWRVSIYDIDNGRPLHVVKTYAPDGGYRVQPTPVLYYVKSWRYDANDDECPSNERRGISIQQYKFDLRDVEFLSHHYSLKYLQTKDGGKVDTIVIRCRDKQDCIDNWQSGYDGSPGHHQKAKSFGTHPIADEQMRARLLRAFQHLQALHGGPRKDPF